MSHAVKTRSFRLARGRNLLILGERLSVRFPSRMVPICVSEPIGLAIPLRMASTPATNVVATAPIPTIITPSLPRAEAILVAVVFSAAEEAIDLRNRPWCEWKLIIFSVWKGICKPSCIDSPGRISRDRQSEAHQTVQFLPGSALQTAYTSE